MLFSGYLDLVGKTPLVRLRSHRPNGLEQVNLHAKLEFYNPTGSVKDRPAAYIVRKLLMTGQIDRQTTLIESSSGNLGVALAAVCRAEGLRFICVVDSLILERNEYLLRALGAEVVKVDTPDAGGGYLGSRIERVQEINEAIPNSLWINQYANPYNAESHYFGTGLELYKVFSDIGLDYAFVAVSSGGTITGVSQALREHFPGVRTVAVDACGSAIFGCKPRTRHIPGMGSSIRPEILKNASIDDVVHVTEDEVVDACHELLRDYGLFVGGSSGATYCAAQHYLKARQFSHVYLEHRRYPRPHPQDGPPKPNAVMIFADRGERYAETIYNPDWCQAVLEGPPEQPAAYNLSQ